MTRLGSKLLHFPKFVYFAAKHIYEEHEIQQGKSRHRSLMLENLINLNIAERYKNSKNDFAKYGASFFSQGDEDGLTLEIVRRIEPKTKLFIEFGVGDGSENNTIILRASGYRGAWIDALENKFLVEAENEDFYYSKNWVNKENVIEIFNNYRGIFKSDPSIISLDLDGNDYWLWESILENGLTPDVAIAEYNPRYPVPIEWVMKYDSSHQWEEDDYFGASLASLSNLFKRFGYTALVCSIQGTNVFFIRNKHLQKFPELTTLGNIYQDAYHIFGKSRMGRVSRRTVLSIIQGDRIEF
jgi:hypothetical protein